MSAGCIPWIKQSLFQLQTLALIYLTSSADKTSAFKDFLDRYAAKTDFSESECFDMFPLCGISQEDLY